MINIKTILTNVNQELPRNPGPKGGKNWEVDVLVRIKRMDSKNKTTVFYAVCKYVKGKYDKGNFVLDPDISGEITHWMKIPSPGEISYQGYDDIIKTYNQIIYSFRNVMDPRQAYKVQVENKKLKELEKKGIFKKGDYALSRVD